MKRELFWTAMLRLTIAVHNKAGLYVHRGSLVANVPGGRRERRGLRSSADRLFYVSVNPPVQGGFDPSNFNFG